MSFQPLFYSLKVWSGSVCLAPLVASVLQFSASGDLHWFTIYLTLYFFFVFLGFILSFKTWLLFWITIEFIVIFIQSKIVRKCLIAIIGILLTIGTFHLLSMPGSSSFNDSPFDMLLGNCIGTVAWSWYFDPVSIVKKIIPSILNQVDNDAKKTI